MSTAGPAFVKKGSHIVYFQTGVSVRQVLATWNTKSANFPSGGERIKSRMWEIEGTPVGEVRDAADLARYWPHAPADIGTDLFASKVALEIVPKTGKKYTFANSALVQMPSMNLGPTSQVWGSMKWAALGDPDIAPNAAGHYLTLAELAGGDADTSFNAAKIISPRFTVSYGSSPYNAIEPSDIIKVEPRMSVNYIGGVNVGIEKGFLTDLGVLAELAPHNLDEDDFLDLLACQGASAKLPGDLVANGTDLIITGTGLILTLKNMGPGAGGWNFSTEAFRFGAVQFHNKLTTTTGAGNPLWTLAVA